MLLCACGSLRLECALLTCDFYLTKYQSKAQQVLSSALGPITSGLRRLENAHGQEEASCSGDKAQVALRKLRRIIFSANRCHWFSACELAVFLLTGGHCICTHKTKAVFTARPRFMMEECKRAKNNIRPTDGSLFAVIDPVSEVLVQSHVIISYDGDPWAPPSILSHPPPPPKLPPQTPPPVKNDLWGNISAHANFQGRGLSAHSVLSHFADCAGGPIPRRN